MNSSERITELKIDDIHITGKRFRVETGKLDQLKASIKEFGLLHPIVIDPEHNLIAGYRRLCAAKSLGMEEIPVRIIQGTSEPHGALLAQRDENTLRKQFTLGEKAAITKALLALEKKAAKSRQGTRTDRHPGKLPRSAAGRAKDKVAAAVGTSRRTLDKMTAVTQAAEQDPAKFGDLKKQMDVSGKVDGSYRELRDRQQADRPMESREQGSEPEPERVTVILVPSDDGAFCAQLEHSSGKITLRSRHALAQFIPKAQAVIKEWANADRVHRLAAKAEAVSPRTEAAAQ